MLAKKNIHALHKIALIYFSRITLRVPDPAQASNGLLLSKCMVKESSYRDNIKLTLFKQLK